MSSKVGNSSSSSGAGRRGAGPGQEGCCRGRSLLRSCASASASAGAGAAASFEGLVQGVCGFGCGSSSGNLVVVVKNISR